VNLGLEIDDLPALRDVDRVADAYAAAAAAPYGRFATTLHGLGLSPY
jgi:hypothetical protein